MLCQAKVISFLSHHIFLHISRFTIIRVLWKTVLSGYTSYSTSHRYHTHISSILFLLIFQQINFEGKWRKMGVHIFPYPQFLFPLLFFCMIFLHSCSAAPSLNGLFSNTRFVPFSLMIGQTTSRKNKYKSCDMLVYMYVYVHMQTYHHKLWGTS